MLSGTRRRGSHQRVASGPRARRAGFTLVEMMIVVVILITLVAIFAPVMRGARNAARRVSTLQLITNLQTATSSFELDQRRLPGVFTQVQMGAAVNNGRGFTQMQNMLLDLSGGVIANGMPSASRINVGPMATGTVLVDLDLINAPLETKGVVKNAYFTIDKKNWTSQNGAGQKVAVMEHVTLPDIVDAFSNPLLAWAEDDGATASDAFAAMASSNRARFYWNSNAAFLRSTSLGRSAKNQTDMIEGSLLSFPLPLEIEYSMHGLLGHPAFPASQVNPMNQVFPASARGKVVFHSAGADGVFLGARDQGGIIATSTSGTNPFFHRQNVVDYRGSKSDPLDNFDDIISVAGN